jgi:hypothetical protein
MGEVTLSNSAYDKLKKVTQLGLPAFGSLYFGLSQIWGLPAGEQVVGSVSLLTVFFGAVLGISSKSYNSGENGVAGDFIVDTRPDGKKVVQLSLDKQPEDIIDQKKIVFNVVDTKQVAQDEFWDPASQV